MRVTLLRVGLLALAIIAAIVVVRILDKRRQGEVIVQYAIPKKVDPADFPGVLDGPSILLFTHVECRACRGARRIAAAQGLPVHEVDGNENPGLLEVYGIDGVPATLLVEADGRVTAGWVGPLDSKVVTAAAEALASSASDETR